MTLDCQFQVILMKYSLRLLESNNDFSVSRNIQGFKVVCCNTCSGYICLFWLYWFASYMLYWLVLAILVCFIYAILACSGYTGLLHICYTGLFWLYWLASYMLYWLVLAILACFIYAILACSGYTGLLHICYTGLLWLYWLALVIASCMACSVKFNIIKFNNAGIGKVCWYAIFTMECCSTLYHGQNSMYPAHELWQTWYS